MYDYLPKEFKIKGISVGDFPFSNFNKKDKKDPDLIAAAIQYDFGNVVHLDISDIENNIPSQKAEIDNFFKDVINHFIDVNPCKIWYFFQVIKNNENFKSFIFKKENLIKCLGAEFSDMYHNVLTVLPKDHLLFNDKDYAFSLLEKMYKSSDYVTNKFCLALMYSKNNNVDYQKEAKMIVFLQKSIEEGNPAICKIAKNLLKNKENRQEFIEYAKKNKMFNKDFFYSFYNDETYSSVFNDVEIIKLFCEETKGMVLTLEQLESLLGGNAKDLNVFKEIVEILAKNNTIESEFWEFTGNITTAYKKNPEFFKVLLNNVVGFAEENVFQVITQPEYFNKSIIELAQKMRQDIVLSSWSDNMWEVFKKHEGHNKNSWFYNYFPSTKINKMSMDDFKEKVDKIVNMFLKNQK